MKILVDTAVWSLGLRRSKCMELAKDQQATVKALTDLVQDTRAVHMGAVRQELLCGIKTPSQFAALRDRLSAFEDVAPSMQDYELAAQAFNTCRANGVQGANTGPFCCWVMPQSQHLYPNEIEGETAEQHAKFRWRCSPSQGLDLP